MDSTDTYTVTLTANAAPAATTYTVSVTAAGNGTTEGGGTYNPGQRAALRAIPGAGSNFNGWYAGEVKVSSLPNYAFTVTEDISLTAKFIAMPQDTLKVTTGNGGVVKLNDNETGLPSNYTNGHTRGVRITLRAAADSGYSFAYWQDNRSESVVSTDPVHSFIMGSSVWLTAVFSRIADESTSEFTVIFKDKSGKILQSTNVQKNAAASPPARTPALAGYTFSGWDNDYTNVVSDLTVNAVYVRKADTYTVTVENGTLSGGGTSGQFQYDMPVTVVAAAAPAGQKFSHWEQDGVKISASGTFSFFAPMRNTTLEAVFVAEATDITETPFITLSAYVQVDTENDNMLFTAHRTVPEGYTLVESGVLLLRSNTELEDELTVDTADVIYGKIKNDSTDQFYIRKSNITAGDTWYGRAYLIYTDEDGNVVTVYSENTENRTME